MGMFSSKKPSEREKAEKKNAKGGLARSTSKSVVYRARTPSGTWYLSQGRVVGKKR